MALRKRSLMARLLTYFLLLSIVPLLFIGSLSYYWGQQRTVSQLTAHLESVLTLKEQEIENWIEHTAHNLSWLATSPEVVNNTAILATHDRSTAQYLTAHESLTSDFRRLVNLEEVSLILLLDITSGRVIASSDAAGEGKLEQTEQYFIQGKNGTYVSDIFYSLALGEPTMVISTPVTRSGRQSLGVLVAHSNLKRLSEIMMERASLGETGETYLVSRDNLLLTESRFKPGDTFNQLVFSEGVSRALNGNSGTALYVDYRGVPVIGAYHWLKDSETVLLAEISQAEAFAEDKHMLNITAMTTGIMLVTVTVLGILLARGISQPITQLAKATEDIAGGNLSYRVAVKNKDEIGLLATAFNQMTNTLEEANRHLSYSESRYREIFENAGEAIITFDRAEIVQSWNRAAEEMFGYKAQEMAGHTFYSLVPKNLIQEGELEKLRQEAEETGKIIRHETQRVRKDGTRIDVALTRSALRDDEGNTIGFIAILLDITERKQMQEKLLIAEQFATLGQFSGSISHELRNPLGVIDSSVYYLKSRLKGTDSKVQEHLDRIKSSVVSATTIIESLLNLTRMKEPQLVRLDLVAVTAEAIATAKVPRTVKVIPNLPGREVLVNADGEQLRLAFKNIVKNAVEAMADKGKLTVTIATAADGQAVVSFTDTGPGIAPENRDRIFQPFFSTKAEGIGFGLSITKMVIDKHGGSIEAKSEPGEGTTIIIRFPQDTSKDKEV